MATKIKVKKITDLTLLDAEDRPDDYGTGIIPGAQDIDQIVVAHHTNTNDEGGARVSIVHTNAMELRELLKYVDNGLRGTYMTMEEGEELKKLIEQKLQEAEDNMARGNDTYSSNYFVDDSGIMSFDGVWQTEDDGKYRYTGEFVFKSAGMANCHLTIYNGSETATTKNIGASITKPDKPAYAQIQMKSRSGWKTLCREPVQNANGAFDVDLHGYFYAGTAIRGAVMCDSTLTATNPTNIIFSYSSLQVTRFSSDKGFPNKSFDWWVSNNGELSSDTMPLVTISENGFFKFDGLYYHDRIGTVGQKAADYYDVKKKAWTHRYCMDAVYANVFSQSGGVVTLGNTENDYLAAKGAGVKDDFSGKYYYVQATASFPVSAFTTTDFMFKDDVKTARADSGGGWHNATLVQYVNFDEANIRFDDLPTEDLFALSDVQSEFGDPKKYHRFKYMGGLGPYLSATVKSDTKLKECTPYIGTGSRNTARLELRPADGTIGCYMRETMGTRRAGATPMPVYSFVPAYGDQMMHTLLRDSMCLADPAGAMPSAEIEYTLDLLNLNIDRFGVSRDVYRFNSKVEKGNVKTDVYSNANVQKFLLSEVSSGWALVDVSLVSSDVGYTVGDFGFAACPRLSAFSFPKGAAFTGRYTFAAPAANLDAISCTATSTTVAKTKSPRSTLSAVDFFGDEGVSAYTHVDGGQTWATFANCVNLERASIQYTDLTSLGDYTFLSCTKLVSVEIPASCESFGNSVFTGCANLSSIVLPTKITSFGTKVFTGCKQFVTANSYKNNRYKYVLGEDYNITIKLSGAQQDYMESSIVNRSKIWSEISGVVNCLQAEKVGQTTAHNTPNSRCGRRFYIKAADGGNFSELTFNTIAQEKGKAFGVDNIVYYNESQQC